MDFETEIRNAILGRTPTNPASLEDIIGTVDAYQKLIISAPELRKGLRTLFAAGTVAELPGHRYFDARLDLGPGSRHFTPISAAQFEAAYERYHASFATIINKRQQAKG